MIYIDAYRIFTNVIAGVSWDALRYGSSPTAPSSGGPDYVVYAEQGGIGFVKNYMVDSHFRYLFSPTLSVQRKSGKGKSTQFPIIYVNHDTF